MKTAFAAAVLLVLALAGCAPRTPVGVWDANVAIGGKQYPAVVTIKADGTETVDITIPKQSVGPVEIPELPITVTGTWKADGKSFTATANELAPGKGFPDMAKPAFDLVQGQIKDQMNKSRTSTLAYKEDGNMQMTTESGMVVTYVKHKG